MIYRYLFFSICLFQYCIYSVKGSETINECIYSIFHEEVDTLLVKENIQNGLYQFNQGNYILAIKYYSKVIDLDLQYPDIFSVRAECYFLLHEYDKSLEDYKEALNHPTHLPKGYGAMYDGIAMNYSKLNKHKEAIDALSHSINLDSSEASAPSYLLRGEEYEKINEYNNAIQDFIIAISKNSKINLTYFDLTRVLNIQGRFKEALKIANQGLIIDPYYTVLHLQKGITLYKLEEYDLAIDEFTFYAMHSADLKTSAEGYFWRASCKIKKKDLKGAEFDISTAIVCDKGNYIGYCYRTIPRFQLKNYQGTIDDCQMCIQHIKKTDTLYVTLAICYDSLGDSRQAEQACLDGIQQKPSKAIYEYLIGLKSKQQDWKSAEQFSKKCIESYASSYAYRILAFVFVQEYQNYRKALEYIDKSVDLDPKSPQSFLLKGRIEKALENKSAALTSFNKAIQLDPKYDEAYYYRATLQENNLTDLNTALKLNPKNYAALRLRVEREVSFENLTAALADANKLISIKPDTGDVYYLRAYVLMKQKNEVGAHTDVNKAIHLDSMVAMYYYFRANVAMQNFSENKEYILKDLDKSIALNEQYGEAYYMRSSIKYEMGYAQSACEDIRRAANLLPSHKQQIAEKLKTFCK